MFIKNFDWGGVIQGLGLGGGQRFFSFRSFGFYKYRNFDVLKIVMDVDYKLLNLGIVVLLGKVMVQIFVMFFFN